MKSFEEKSIQSYDLKADGYDDTFDGRFTARFKELILDEISLNPGDCVLDVACGNGTLLKMLSDKFKIQGYGTDISGKMVENAGKKCPEMTFEVCGCESTPFPDHMFDAVTVCAAYHHFPDTGAFAKEANRLLKPGGMIYIADVYYPFLIRKILNPFIPLSKAGDVKFYSSGEIQRNFQAYCFEGRKLRIEGHIQLVLMQKSID